MQTNLLAVAAAKLSAPCTFLKRKISLGIRKKDTSVPCYPTTNTTSSQLELTNDALTSAASFSFIPIEAKNTPKSINFFNQKFMLSNLRLLGMTAAVILLSFITSFAQAQATLISDKDDYAPGTTATLTGSGFQAGEQVKMQVLHADGTPATGADHDPWYVTADANGNFVTTWHVCEDDCVGSTLRATADGQSSKRHAEVVFTDGNNDLFLYASNCLTLKAVFCLGETVCVKATTCNCTTSAY